MSFPRARIPAAGRLFGLNLALLPPGVGGSQQPIDPIDRSDQSYRSQ